MSSGKGFGGGEATRDPEPTAIDPDDPKGKQQAIHKAESFAEYLAKRAGGDTDAAPATPPANDDGEYVPPAAGSDEPAPPAERPTRDPEPPVQSWSPPPGARDGATLLEEIRSLESAMEALGASGAGARERLSAPSVTRGDGTRNALDIISGGFTNLLNNPFGWFFGPPSPLYSNVDGASRGRPPSAPEVAGVAAIVAAAFYVATSPLEQLDAVPQAVKEVANRLMEVGK